MSNIVKNTVLIAMTTMVMLGTSILNWVKPPEIYSDSERRVLAEFPELSIETILNGEFTSKFETYTQDQFPFRDELRSLKALAVYKLFGQLENNDIYMVGDYISKLDYPLNEYMLNNSINKFNSIYDKFIKSSDCSVYLSIIPDKNYFLAADNGYLSINYEYMINTLTNKLNYMEYIDITNVLNITDYYLTDTHWKQENISKVADKIAESMGVRLDAEYEVKQATDSFNGVYVGQIAMPVKIDKLNYIYNPYLDDVIVTDYDTGMPKESRIYNLDEVNGKDPYEMFTSGSTALLVIENPNATSDKELIIFRDSFGSSISPYFVEAYSRITLVDIRYIQSNMLGSIIKFDNQDVLFLYSTMLLNNSLAFK